MTACADLQPIEEWRAWAGFPDYEVSDQGRVRRITKSRSRWPAGRVMSPCVRDGLAYVRLVDVAKADRTKLVRLLVAEAFIGPSPAPDLIVTHKDGNKENCHARNLAWGKPRSRKWIGIRKVQRVVDWPANEEWRTLQRYPDYQVSDQGRVRRIKVCGRPAEPPYLVFSRLLKGHLVVGLYREEGMHPTNRYVAHLVLEAFTGKIPMRNSLLFKDGNRGNCTLSNLSVKERQRKSERCRAQRAQETVAPIEIVPFRPKLTRDDVVEIRCALHAGESPKLLAERYGITEANIRLYDFKPLKPLANLGERHDYRKFG